MMFLVASKLVDAGKTPASLQLLDVIIFNIVLYYIFTVKK
jgi:hypothetical protein